MLLVCRQNVRVLVSLGVLFANLTPLYAQREVDLRPRSVATFNGTVVTEDELRKAAAPELEQLRIQAQQMIAGMSRAEHQVLESKLIRLLADKMFDAEASKRGVSREKFLEAELAGKIRNVSAEEIKAFYEANKLRYNQPLEKVSAEIRKVLSEERRSQAIGELADRLKAQYGVTTLLPPLRVRVKTDGSPSLGPKEAPVTIDVFSDFQSSFCAQLDKTLHEVVRKYGKEIRLVYHHFALPNLHADAGKAAEASYCAADQGRFWEMHDLIFETQNQLKDGDLRAKAAKLKLDTGGFNECLASGKYGSKVKDDLKEGHALGVAATPTMFINGRFLSGALPISELSKTIDEEVRIQSQRAALTAAQAGSPAADKAR